MASLAEVEATFAMQVEWCERLGSPFTSRLLQLALDDIRANGPVFDLVGDWPGHAQDDVIALRFSGVMNALVLAGKAPALAAQYPAQTDASDWDVIRTEMLAALKAHDAEVRAFMLRPVQTNEIGRSAVLLPGFCTLAKMTDAPFHMLEIGASAGLNLLWDRFHYDLAGVQWGNSDSPVKFTPEWKGKVPDLSHTPKVVSRAAVDINPLDLSTDAAVTAASSYIWPDQLERLARFKAAAQMLQQAGLKVEKADALDWLTDKLGKRPDKGVTVLYHSVMWQYMPPQTRDGITHLMEDEGATASKDAPLAWLAFEPEHSSALPELRLRLWDGTDAFNERLAWCHPHGTNVEWLKDTP